MSASIDITLPDGRVERVPEGTSGADLAARLGPAVGESAIAVRVDGRLRDLSFPLAGAAHVSFVLPGDPDALEIVRHTTSHVMAQAVKELFPDARIAQGPAIEDGFYYDFDREQPFTDEDLPRIEERMREIVARDLPIRRHESPKETALEIFGAEAEPYKVELIVREQSGPSPRTTSRASSSTSAAGRTCRTRRGSGAFKLLSVAGAYWRGTRRTQMLQRIYGTAFPTQAELEAHLARLEEAKKRDHRRLGRELDLFSIRGARRRRARLLAPAGQHRPARDRGLLARGALQRRRYDFVYTPHIARRQLWETVGPPRLLPREHVRAADGGSTRQILRSSR